MSEIAFPVGTADATPDPRLRLLAWIAGLFGILLVSWLDYASGTELRVYPLYFGPVSLIAWHGRRLDVIAVGALSAGAWAAGNALAGMRFSTDVMWAANAGVHGTAFLIVGVLINALRRASRTARDLSRTDSLTQLRNSRAFYEDAQPLLALCRRRGRPITMAYLDLDRFKSVNDHHGHEAGDDLLRTVARAVRESTRGSDLVARLGGDEFAVMLPELGPAEAVAALERLRQAVGTAAPAEMGVTASVGGITCLAAPHGLHDLLRDADRLMYSAKTGGRDRVVHEVVDAEMSELATPDA